MAEPGQRSEVQDVLIEVPAVAITRLPIRETGKKQAQPLSETAKGSWGISLPTKRVITRLHRS